MIGRYAASLAGTVLLITLLTSLLPFAMRACVLNGSTVNEDVAIKFAVDAGGDRTYVLPETLATGMGAYVVFLGQGPVQVTEAKSNIFPGEVSWFEGPTRVTAQGGDLWANLQWKAASDANNGASGKIYVTIPEFGFGGKSPTLHGGQYHQTGNGEIVVREVTVFRNPALLFLARFGVALGLGLPLGLLLHTIGWWYVVRRVEQIRIEKLPERGNGLPQTFYPSPTKEWQSALMALGAGSLAVTILATLSVWDNYVSTSLAVWIYLLVAAAGAAAIGIARYVAQSVLTISVNAGGISYRLGRKTEEWTSVSWDEIARVVERSRTYRGETTQWMELEFKDGRAMLHIASSTVDYAALWVLLMRDRTEAAR